MKLTIFTIFTILFLVLSGADALVDPYMGKNVTGITHESAAITDSLFNFYIFEEIVQHPLIPDSMQVRNYQHERPENLNDKNDDKNENENHIHVPKIKKKKGYSINFLGVIFSLIFMPFMLMIALFGYLVALCVVCIHELTILFFAGVFILFMLLFKRME